MTMAPFSRFDENNILTAATRPVRDPARALDSDKGIPVAVRPRASPPTKSAFNMCFVGMTCESSKPRAAG